MLKLMFPLAIFLSVTAAAFARPQDKVLPEPACQSEESLIAGVRKAGVETKMTGSMSPEAAGLFAQAVGIKDVDGVHLYTGDAASTVAVLMKGKCVRGLALIPTKPADKPKNTDGSI